MDHLRFDSIYLEQEQKDLFSWMVDSENRLQPDQRRPFSLFEVYGEAFLHHLNVTERPSVRRGDLETLAENGLLRRGYVQRSRTYEITPRGRLYYSEMRRREGEPVQHIEQEVTRYLSSESFRSRHEAAYGLWQESERELWSAETPGQLTKIGHICREAVQEFAESACRVAGLPPQPNDPAKTVARIRAVLDQLAGDARKNFLKALLAYWGTASDLGANAKNTALAKNARSYPGKTHV